MNQFVRTDVQVREHESDSLEREREVTNDIHSAENISEFFASHLYLRNFLILMGIVCCISATVVIKSSKRITKSLKIITEGTKRIASGDIESPLLIDGVESDIKELGESFNSMMSKLREKEEKNRGLFLQVKRGRDEWQATFDSITDVITILDKNFRIVRANKTFFENFNVDKTRLKEKKCFEVYHGTDSPRENCPLLRCINNLKTESEEVADTRMDGIFLVTVFPLVDERGEFYGAVHQIKDITFQKRLHKELIKKADKLDEANKELERLAKIVSELI
ncbi:MAG: hypothetical protein SCALA701_27910 [Candidatus Scalindua sp.]|nr:MAG: hypothetical protein SCALA701_27910 [Candidatus Scalindua sp.]